eukprot:scaffold1563_cov142-Skeletonema_marinoi.AAC.2
MLPRSAALLHFHRTKSLEAEGRRSGKETPELVHRLAAFLMPTDTFYHQFNPFTTQRSPQLTSLAQLDDVRDVKTKLPERKRLCSLLFALRKAFEPSLRDIGSQ